jgi:hypothetical protein
LSCSRAAGHDSLRGDGAPWDALAASCAIRWRSEQSACTRRHEDGYVVARVVVPWSCRSRFARKKVPEREREGQLQHANGSLYRRRTGPAHPNKPRKIFSVVVGIADCGFTLVTSSSAVATVERRSLRLASPALHSTANRPTARAAGASACDPPERSLAPSTRFGVAASQCHFCCDDRIAKGLSLSCWQKAVHSMCKFRSIIVI